MAEKEVLKKVRKYPSRLLKIKSGTKSIAYYDELTGLKNRRAFFEELKQVLNRKKGGALCLVSISNFKEINDTFGHVKGEKILLETAKRISGVKSEDINFYRIGDDKLISTVLGDAKEIDHIVENIVETSRNYIINPKSGMGVSCFWGISTFPKDGLNPEDLLSKADTAMYYAQHVSEVGHAYFVPYMQDELNRKTEISNILKKALREKEFKLLYQPIIDSKSGSIVSFEALLRLSNYKIPPLEFIRIAEERGMINEIGKMVAAEAVGQLKRWKEKGFELKPVAINISPHQIRDTKFAIFIKKLLNMQEVDAQYLEVEVTEDVFIQKSREVINVIEQLSEAGIKISLDDFGSGYSSLTYLTFLPVHKVKIDKSMIDLYSNQKNLSILKHTINIAHDLNFDVVAEGVESKEQYEILKKLGCDLIQGYYFSKPVEADVVEKMLEKKSLPLM